MSELANYVKELRSDKNMTQQDLADEVGVSRQTIISIEKENYVPSVLLSLKISSFFKKKVEEVFVLSK